MHYDIIKYCCHSNYMFPNFVDMKISDLTLISFNLMKFSSFGTLFLDHNVSQLFVMSQLTIAERQFLVEHYFKSYGYGRNNGSVVLFQEPLMNLRRTLLE